MTDLERMKLKAFQMTSGIDPMECTADEWLSLAIQSEEMSRQCGPFDPAFTTLTSRAHYYMRAAELRERFGV